MTRKYQTSFMGKLNDQIADMGGLFNAHLHIDRAETLDATLKMLEIDGAEAAFALTIAQKHGLIPMIHDSECYDPKNLENRVQSCLDRMIDLGTSVAHSVVDVTVDRVGLTALQTLKSLGDRNRDLIDFRVGAYTPLGLRDDEPERWNLLEEGAAQADFIGALPERDDQADYPEHIGFDACCDRILDLAFRLQKKVHIHVDQKNHDRECHTERVIRLVRQNGYFHHGDEPLIWLIHVISPSAYDENRFQSLVNDLSELNIGVICCPSAAISMRQNRNITSPTHNSIARVLDMLGAGVFVRLGNDNVCDITSPYGSLDLMDELFVLAHAVRYYDLDLLASLGAGVRITDDIRDRLITHLAADRKECAFGHDQYAAVSQHHYIETKDA